jgi:hypothetical protein
MSGRQFVVRQSQFTAFYHSMYYRGCGGFALYKTCMGDYTYRIQRTCTTSEQYHVAEHEIRYVH